MRLKSDTYYVNIYKTYQIDSYHGYLCPLVAYFFHWFTSGSSEHPNSCGAANAGLVILTLLIAAVYFLTFIILTLSNKGKKRLDYLIFLGFVLTPLLFVVGSMYFTS